MVDPGNSQSDQDTAKRRDEALRRALNTPPKPHKKPSRKSGKSDNDFSTENVSGGGRQPFQGSKKPSR